MLSGFYTAASGMLVQQRTLNVLTNNIANVKTPGYRAERVVSTTFEHELMTRIEKGNTEVIGSGDPIRIVNDVPVNFEMSSLEDTGRPYDFGLVGEGFFNIQTAPEVDENGDEVGEGRILLTRKGNFDVDDEGFLILPGVGRVLGRRGEIELKDANFTVNKEGEILNERGRVIDEIMITKPNEDVQLEKIENGLYAVNDPEEDMYRVYDTAVHQGKLEQSNIDINREYTLVMEAQRAFQSCSQAIKIVDSMNQKAATQIASL
ncbi:MAG: flagellar hook-basal body protein [Oscillospiraceae bacterium]|nr:flagellar hook-basal body protein [Oscillospiraceae bacterium]